MAKQAAFYPGMALSKAITDRDWITIIGALLRHRSPESQRLATKLLARTRHGRQIQMLRLIRDKSPRLLEIQRRMKISRRTVFRYLTSLEVDGAVFWIDDDFRYHVSKTPSFYKSVM